MRRLLVALALVVVAAACRYVRAPPPQPATTPERALEELPPERFPRFADDLDLAGLDAALDRSLAWLGKLAVADPGRTFAFGKERVPLPKMQATLRRFK